MSPSSAYTIPQDELMQMPDSGVDLTAASIPTTSRMPRRSWRPPDTRRITGST